MTRPFNRLLAGAPSPSRPSRSSPAAAGATRRAARRPTPRRPRRRRRASRSALVADAGQLNDNGFNELAYKGLKRAEHELGIEGRVVEAKSAADYVPNMSTLARQGYDLVIGVGFAQGDAIAATAKQFPDTKFAIVDVDQASLKGKPANVVGLLFREEQVGYLVGYLGALEAKRAGAKSISAVGGFKEPPVDRFIAGYRAGAEAAVPGTKVKWDYSQDWEDQAKCKELALNQIAAGSKVVFQVAGGCGLGALSAAKDKNVWGIGVDADQSFLGPHVLTSALKGVDSAVFLDDQGGQGRDVQGRAQRRLRPRPGGRRARHAEPEGERRRRRRDREGRAAASPTARSRTSRPRSADGAEAAAHRAPSRSRRTVELRGAHRVHRRQVVGDLSPRSRRRRPSRTPRPTSRRSRAPSARPGPRCRTPRGGRSGTSVSGSPSPRGVHVAPASRVSQTRTAPSGGRPVLGADQRDHVGAVGSAGSTTIGKPKSEGSPSPMSIQSGAAVVGAVDAAVELHEQPLGLARRAPDVVDAVLDRVVARLLGQVVGLDARVRVAPRRAAVVGEPHADGRDRDEQARRVAAATARSCAGRGRRCPASSRVASGGPRGRG